MGSHTGAAACLHHNMMEHHADMHGGKQAQACQNDRKYDQSAAIWLQNRMPVRQTAKNVVKTLRRQFG
jgi:hypothetical protein